MLCGAPENYSHIEKFSHTITTYTNRHLLILEANVFRWACFTCRGSPTQCLIFYDELKNMWKQQEPCLKGNTFLVKVCYCNSSRPEKAGFCQATLHFTALGAHFVHAWQGRKLSVASELMGNLLLNSPTYWHDSYAESTTLGSLIRLLHSTKRVKSEHIHEVCLGMVGKNRDRAM